MTNQQPHREFLIGKAGSDEILTQLTQKAGSGIHALKFLDLLGISRSQASFSILNVLIEKMLERIKQLPIEDLEPLLKTTYPYIGFSELRRIPLVVMCRHPSMPIALINSLKQQLQVLNIQIPIEVIQQVWLYDIKGFYEVLMPWISAYILDRISSPWLKLTDLVNSSTNAVPLSSCVSGLFTHQPNDLTTSPSSKHTDQSSSYNTVGGIGPNPIATSFPSTIDAFPSTLSTVPSASQSASTPYNIFFPNPISLSPSLDLNIALPLMDPQALLISNPSSLTLDLWHHLQEMVQLMHTNSEPPIWPSGWQEMGDPATTAISTQLAANLLKFETAKVQANQPFHSARLSIPSSTASVYYPSKSHTIFSYHHSTPRSKSLPLQVIADYVGENVQLYKELLSFIKKLYEEVLTTTYLTKTSSEIKNPTPHALPISSILADLDFFSDMVLNSRDKDIKQKPQIKLRMHGSEHLAPRLLVALASLRFELIMSQHDRNHVKTCEDDPVYRFSWCLGACIRDSRFDERHLEEMQTILSTVQAKLVNPIKACLPKSKLNILGNSRNSQKYNASKSGGMTHKRVNTRRLSQGDVNSNVNVEHDKGVHDQATIHQQYNKNVQELKTYRKSLPHNAKHLTQRANAGSTKADPSSSCSIIAKVQSGLSGNRVAKQLYPTNTKSEVITQTTDDLFVKGESKLHGQGSKNSTTSLFISRNNSPSIPKPSDTVEGGNHNNYKSVNDVISNDDQDDDDQDDEEIQPRARHRLVRLPKLFLPRKRQSTSQNTSSWHDKHVDDADESTDTESSFEISDQDQDEDGDDNYDSQDYATDDEYIGPSSETRRLNKTKRKKNSLLQASKKDPSLHRDSPSTSNNRAKNNNTSTSSLLDQLLKTGRSTVTTSHTPSSGPILSVNVSSGQNVIGEKANIPSQSIPAIRLKKGNQVLVDTLTSVLSLEDKFNIKLPPFTGEMLRQGEILADVAMVLNSGHSKLTLLEAIFSCLNHHVKKMVVAFRKHQHGATISGKKTSMSSISGNNTNEMLNQIIDTNKIELDYVDLPISKNEIHNYLNGDRKLHHLLSLLQLSSSHQELSQLSKFVPWILTHELPPKLSMHDEWLAFLSRLLNLMVRAERYAYQKVVLTKKISDMYKQMQNEAESKHRNAEVFIELLGIVGENTIPSSQHLRHDGLVEETTDLDAEIKHMNSLVNQHELGKEGKQHMPFENNSDDTITEVMKSSHIEFINELNHLLVENITHPSPQISLVFSWILNRIGSGDDHVVAQLSTWLQSDIWLTIQTEKVNDHKNGPSVSEKFSCHELENYPEFIQELLYGFACNSSPKVLLLRSYLIDSIIVPLASHSALIHLQMLLYLNLACSKGTLIFVDTINLLNQLIAQPNAGRWYREVIEIRRLYHILTQALLSRCSSQHFASLKNLYQFLDHDLQHSDYVQKEIQNPLK